MTEEDILFRVKLSQLQEKLTQKVTEDAKKVSTRRSRSTTRRTRSASRSRSAATCAWSSPRPRRRPSEAAQALESGQSWKDVVKQYSIDEASKAQGGKLAAVAKGQQDKALEDAVFAAEQGRAAGPGQDPVRLVRVRGREDHAGLAAVARAVARHDQEPAALRAPAEGAGRVHQGLPRGVQGRDRTAPTTTASPSARTRRRRRPTPAPASRPAARLRSPDDPSPRSSERGRISPPR